MKYERRRHTRSAIFTLRFILHSSFFIEFCEAKFFWASRFAHFVRLRRAIRGSLRSYLRRRFASAWYGALRAPPLLSLSRQD
jgi:hypothetical protein